MYLKEFVNGTISLNGYVIKWIISTHIFEVLDIYFVVYIFKVIQLDLISLYHIAVDNK